MRVRDNELLIISIKWELISTRKRKENNEKEIIDICGFFINFVFL